MEAPPGFEPGIAALQAAALATWRRSHIKNIANHDGIRTHNLRTHFTLMRIYGTLPLSYMTSDIQSLLAEVLEPPTQMNKEGIHLQ